MSSKDKRMNAEDYSRCVARLFGKMTNTDYRNWWGECWMLVNSGTKSFENIIHRLFLIKLKEDGVGIAEYPTVPTGFITERKEPKKIHLQTWNKKELGVKDEHMALFIIKDELNAICNGVPEKYKKVLGLYLKGCNYDEIAEICSITEQTVHNRINRTVEKIRNEINKERIFRHK